MQQNEYKARPINRKKAIVARKQWEKENPERVSEWHKEYFVTNFDEISRRRMVHHDELRRELILLLGGKCVECGIMGEEEQPCLVQTFDVETVRYRRLQSNHPIGDYHFCNVCLIILLNVVYHDTRLKVCPYDGSHLRYWTDETHMLCVGDDGWGGCGGVVPKDTREDDWA